MSEPRQATLAECNKQLVDSMKNEKKIIEMIGPAGRINVPKSDEILYRQKGYSVVVESASNDKKATTSPQKQTSSTVTDDGGDNSGNDGNGPKVDFSQFDDEQITDFAKQAGLPGNVKKRETIIAKLVEQGFVPDTVVTDDGGDN